MKYAVYTLGCKVNQFETQAVERALREAGWTPVKEKAEVIIINTCAVTAESGRKSRQAIRRLQSRNPMAFTAVCGCYSQLEPEAVRELGVDILFGTGDKKAFIQALLTLEKSELIDDPFRRRVLEPLASGAYTGRTRAMVKIQDGCDNFCSYCVIPYTRGRVRSLPVADCAEQARSLAAEGFGEIVVTGIEIASYGKDLPGKPTLAEAVCAMQAAAPDSRLHLGSLEPTVVTEEFCRRLSAQSRLCRHFHLALQSGCDATLKRMNRKYDTALFLSVCDRLRKYFPGCSLTADVIFGFPGETEADFQATLQFMERAGLSYVHCFPYSVRPGTGAAAMEAQLSTAEKERRVAEAERLVDALQQSYLASCRGQIYPVLFENAYAGHADNYCMVEVTEPQPRGVVKNVKITDVKDKSLFGFVV